MEVSDGHLPREIGHFTECTSGRARHQSALPHPLLPDLRSLATQVANDQGYELCGIQLLTHLSPMTLELQIRHTSGRDVSLDDCAGFSGIFGDALETSSLLAEEPYVLEISSPGIGEQLGSDRDFKTFRGFPIEVTHLDQNDSTLCVEGLLLGRDEDTLQINIRGRIKRINRDRVVNVRLTSPGV